MKYYSIQLGFIKCNQHFFIGHNKKMSKEKNLIVFNTRVDFKSKSSFNIHSLLLSSQISRMSEATQGEFSVFIFTPKLFALCSIKTYIRNLIMLF